MEMQLIQGSFSAEDAADIISKMINIKIEYHQSKIDKSSNEEDIKMREERIKQLQRHLVSAKNYINQQGGKIALDGKLHFYN